MDFFLTFVVTVLFCVLALDALYKFALKVQLVDYPDERKAHKGQIPLIGGIAMFVGFMAVLLISTSNLNDVRGVIISSSIIIVVGILDDCNNISVRFRFLMQAIAILIMTYFSGLVLSDLGGVFGTAAFPLQAWAVPFTVVAAVGVMNAMNMTDGIDGLAGVSALICFLGVVLLQFLSGEIEIIPLMFVAVLIPFILFNLRTVKKVFMGDAGSMFIGFGVFWVLVESCQGEGAVMNTVTALWLFLVPLIDTVAVMFRRMMKGRSPFSSDRMHLHHIFLNAGFSERTTLYVMSLLSVLFASIGVMGEIYQVAEWIMFSGFMLVFIVYLWWRITYAGVFLQHIRKLSSGLSESLCGSSDSLDN